MGLLRRSFHSLLAMTDFRRDYGILYAIAPSALLPRNDAGNSRIPYGDPPRGLGDDIVENFRISKYFCQSLS